MSEVHRLRPLTTADSAKLTNGFTRPLNRSEPSEPEAAS